MPNVVTLFSRRSSDASASTQPKHRRDGWFDDQDRWHDADEPAAVAQHG